MPRISINFNPLFPSFFFFRNDLHNSASSLRCFISTIIYRQIGPFPSSQAMISMDCTKNRLEADCKTSVFFSYLRGTKAKARRTRVAREGSSPEFVFVLLSSRASLASRSPGLNSASVFLKYAKNYACWTSCTCGCPQHYKYTASSLSFPRKSVEKNASMSANVTMSWRDVRAAMPRVASSVGVARY